MNIETNRLNAFESAADTTAAMMNVEAAISASGLDPTLLELIRLRSSQINGCAFCLQMHSQQARNQGETEQRIYLLNAWQESSLFSDRERAALAWTEVLSHISSSHAPDEVYDRAASLFSATELANLTIAIGQINSWNRIATGLGYQPSGVK